MGQEVYHFRWFPLGELAEDAKRIRLEVFCKEQGYRAEDEFDGIDKSAHHIVCYQGQTPVATGRMYSEENDKMHLGRIAVLKEHRGTGLGLQLVKEMIKRAGIMNAKSLQLSAQTRAIGFYEKLGFSVKGEPYMDGHVPHNSMFMML